MATDLITKLEEAGEGSRELDALIEDVFDPLITCDGPGSHADFVGDEQFEADVGHYTTSLDAALALAERVLPDARVQMNTGTGWVRLVTTDGRYDYGFFAAAHASTPALALCAAILRASEQERGG
ncbi:hypothetical protein [Brevundimonas sp.]|uniref:hypothetical protein n=1 Tax=Brevundimonas sp. TaxID=1871086 RepID=UPI0035B4480A